MFPITRDTPREGIHELSLLSQAMFHDRSSPWGAHPRTSTSSYQALLGSCTRIWRTQAEECNFAPPDNGHVSSLFNCPFLLLLLNLSTYLIEDTIVITMKEGLSDDAQLAQLGHAQSFERQFSRWTMLGLAFAILNSWTALAASLSLALPSGGPVAVVWGLVAAGICNLSLAASLAELLSAYPTAGGE